MRKSMIVGFLLVAIGASESALALDPAEPVHNLRGHSFCFPKEFKIHSDPNSPVADTPISPKKPRARVRCAIRTGGNYDVPRLIACPDPETVAEKDYRIEHSFSDPKLNPNRPGVFRFDKEAINPDFTSFKEFPNAAEIAVAKRKTAKLVQTESSPKGIVEPKVTDPARRQFIIRVDNPLLKGFICYSRSRSFDVNGMTIQDLEDAVGETIAIDRTESLPRATATGPRGTATGKKPSSVGPAK